MFKLFHRNEINPFPVSDKITFRNGDNTIKLSVRKSATDLLRGIKAVSKRMQDLTDDTPEEEQKAVALAFASVIFGDDQAQNLLEFYDNSPLAVITVCGIYLRGTLSEKITKAQTVK